MYQPTGVQHAMPKARTKPIRIAAPSPEDAAAHRESVREMALVEATNIHAVLTKAVRDTRSLNVTNEKASDAAFMIMHRLSAAGYVLR